MCCVSASTSTEAMVRDSFCSNIRYWQTLISKIEVYPALSFACKIDWIDSPDYKYGYVPSWLSNVAADNSSRSSTPPQNAQGLEAAETKPSTGSEPLSGLQLSSSTNTFRVPDDSDVEEIPSLNASHTAKPLSPEPYPRENVPVAQLDGQRDIHDPPKVRDADSVILDEHLIDYSDSGEEESDLESNGSLSSDSSSVSFAAHDIELKSECESDEDYESERSDCEAESEQELELESDIDDGSSIAHSLLGLVDDICMKPWGESNHNSIDPVMVAQKDQPGCCQNDHREPHAPPVVAHEELPQRDPLSLQSSPHKSGPFSQNMQTSPGKTASDRTLVKFDDAPLKRKASELEDQGAQVPESVLPAAQASLGTTAQPEVVEAISSALSETEPPKKRAKYSHPSSGTVASYTATAVVSALLGGLGTVVLLAALPAEYFQ